MDKEEGLMLWGSLARLIDKVEAEAERLQWDEVINLAADVFSEVDNSSDGEKVFFGPYQFLFRLYYRLKAYDKPKPFNDIHKATHLDKHEDKLYYRIYNYDYKMFKWVNKNNFKEFLCNNYVDIPVDKLDVAQVKGFEAKIKN